MKNKVLFFDIETAPNLAYVWGKYEQDVISYKDEWFMMAFAYKWQGKDVQVCSLPDFPSYKKDKQYDGELVKKLHSILSEADIIVAHNGVRFDIRKSNARFIYYNLPPIPPSKFIDTRIVAKRHFMFNSNKLDDLCQHLGIGAKVHTGGFSLWQGCMKGDKKSWKKMAMYNKNDVVILEKLYKKLLPWIENTIISSGDACPKCGSTHFNQHGFYFTNLKRYARVQCQVCGQWCKQKT